MSHSRVDTGLFASSGSPANHVPPDHHGGGLQASGGLPTALRTCPLTPASSWGAGSQRVSPQVYKGLLLLRLRKKDAPPSRPPALSF